MWPEVTDPQKFVYEDVAIATSLLVRTFFIQAHVEVAGVGGGMAAGRCPKVSSACHTHSSGRPVCFWAPRLAAHVVVSTSHGCEQAA